MARDAAERVADLLQRHRLAQRRLLAQSVPRDCAEPAVAERDQQDHAFLVGDARQRLARCPGQLHVGQQDVRLVLLADEVDAELAAHGAVRAIAPDHVVGAHGVAARALQRNPVTVLGQPNHLGAADDLDPEFFGAGLQDLLRSALRHDEHHPEPGGQLPQVQRRAARRRNLADRHTPGQQLVGQTPRVEQLEGASVHGESPGDVRHVGALVEQFHLDATQREFTRQHQAGRASAHHNNIGSLHEPGW